MRIFRLLAAGASITQAAAAEESRAETCRKGEDVRVIEVVAPGTVGAACDVVYVRDGGANVAVPYNANVDKDFCRARAAELAARLISEGFECSTAASDAIEAALAGGAAPAETLIDAPLNVQLKQIAGAQTSPSNDAPAQIEPMDQPQAAAAEGEAAPAAERESDAPLAEHNAPAGPIQLAADAQPSAFRAPRPTKTTGAGRLVGARPPIDDIVDPAVDSKSFDAANAAGVPAQSTEEIIRGVIAANAAAWNEGNLDAFMAGYANVADLMLVKNAVLTTGWSEVKAAYEQEIAANGGMGRLSFNEIEVAMTTDDAATITGRYAIRRGGSASEGSVTFVMKRVDGRWRIVQDTRVAGARPMR